jgi:uncharacterized protein YeaO (DUF488 family)
MGITAANVKLKRADAAAVRDDGPRVLVDRLWPTSKAAAGG